MGVLDPEPTFGDVFRQQSVSEEFTQPQTPAGSGLMDSLQAYKQQQAESLAQHRDYGQRLQQVSDATQQRGSDLHLVERLFTILDDRVPKGTKQFLYREMARTLGMDPKSGVTGEVGQMLAGLDPQSAQVMRGLIAQQMKDADPGMVQQLVKGIMSGTVPMHQVTRMAGAAAAQQQAAQGQELMGKVQMPEQATARPPGMMRLGGPQEQQTAQADAAPSPQGMRPDTDPWKGIPPEKQPVEPEMNSYLGLQPGRRYTHDELVGFFPRLPSDRGERAKLREKLNLSEASTVETLNVGGAMLAMMEGRPEVLAQAGWISTASEGVKSFLEAIGAVTPTDNWLRDKASSKIIQFSGVNPNAVDAGIMRSLTESFAVALAKRNNPGRAPTDNDYRAALRQIGASQSPEVFAGVVKSVVAHTYEADRQLLQTSVGTRVEMDPSRLNKQQIGALVESLGPRMSKEYAQQLKDAYTGTRPAPKGEGAEQTGQAPARPAGKAEAHEQAVQQAQLERQKQQESDRALARSITIRNDERAERAEGRAEEQLSMAKRREVREEQRENRQMIQRAFEILAKALGDPAVPQVRGGGGGGQDQDPRAFQLPARPQRQAPRPSQAGR